MLIVKPYHVFIQIFPSSEDTRICENIGERSLTSSVIYYYYLVCFDWSFIKYFLPSFVLYFLSCYMRLLYPILPQDSKSAPDKRLPPVELFNKVWTSIWKFSHIGSLLSVSIWSKPWIEWIIFIFSNQQLTLMPSCQAILIFVSFLIPCSCPLDLKGKLV